MERSREDLIRSRIALKVAIEALQHELSFVERQLEEKKSEASLTDNFFWTVLVPILEPVPEGMTSAQLKKALAANKHPANTNALTTFLSRNKSKNRLKLDEAENPPRWKLRADLIRPEEPT